MARFAMMNLDSVIAEVKKRSDNAEKAMRAAVDAAGDVFVDEIRKNIRAKDIWDTGALYASVKKGKVVEKGGAYKLEAYPQGVRTDAHHPKGERNEIIGFVNEYGRRAGKGYGGQANNYPARPFVAPAAKSAVERATEAARAVLEREING